PYTSTLSLHDALPISVYGDSVRARLHGGVLHLVGELVSDQERQKLIREARQFVGRGLDDVDARRLRVKRPDSPRGVLDQTIIAADRKSTRLNSSHLVI